MNVEILQLAEGARKAKGTAVIIDVFRAFTVEAYLFAQGAKEIYAVYDKTLAEKMKEEDNTRILIGERHGKILPGFAYGNSPSSIYQKDFFGKTIVHSTTNGTLGIQNAIHAKDVFVASLVNAKATAEAILQTKTDTVSLVCMGWEGKETEEDTLCAQYIASLLKGEEFKDIQEQADALRYTEGKKFFDSTQQDVFPEADFALCVDVDRFDFAIHAKMIGTYAQCRKEIIHG